MGNTDKFDMIANRYDTDERIHIAKVTADAIREYVIDGGSKHAIDFGSGTGLVGMNLMNDFGSILFIDASQNMIRQLEQKLADHHIQNAQTLCCDFEREHRSNLHADYIFMAQVLLHIKDVKSILSRLYDVLNPGGHMLIVDFNKNEQVDSDMVHNGFDQQELADVMTQIGYKKIQSKTFYSGEKIFMGQDASLFILDAQK